MITENVLARAAESLYCIINGGKILVSSRSRNELPKQAGTGLIDSYSGLLWPARLLLAQHRSDDLLNRHYSLGWTEMAITKTQHWGVSIARYLDIEIALQRWWQKHVQTCSNFCSYHLIIKRGLCGFPKTFCIAWYYAANPLSPSANWLGIQGIFQANQINLLREWTNGQHVSTVGLRCIKEEGKGGKKDFCHSIMDHNTTNPLSEILGGRRRG